MKFAAFCGPFFRGFGNKKIHVKLGEKFFAAESVEVLYNAVIGEDLQIFRRKHAGNDEVVILGAGVNKTLTAKLFSCKVRALRAVMAVGDIEGRNMGKSRFPDSRFGDSPNPLFYALRASKIVYRLTLDRRRYQTSNRARIAKGEKYQAGLGTYGQHMPGAVLYLFRTNIFVLFDQAFLIFLQRTTPDDACLGTAVGSELVNI